MLSRVRLDISSAVPEPRPTFHHSTEPAVQTCQTNNSLSNICTLSTSRMMKKSSSSPQCCGSGSDKKCHKTRNRSNKLNRYFFEKLTFLKKTRQILNNLIYFIKDPDPEKSRSYPQHWY